MYQKPVLLSCTLLFFLHQEDDHRKAASVRSEHCSEIPKEHLVEISEGHQGISADPGGRQDRRLHLRRQGFDLVREADIIRWKQYNDLQFIQCTCRFTENCTMCDNGDGGSKRQEIKALLKQLRSVNPAVDKNIFRSVENVNLQTIISYHRGNDYHHFLDDYDEGRSIRGTVAEAVNDTDLS